MILEELRLHNFCLYRGSHVFDLRPKSHNGMTCPIVLFGGMNGAGKTTILDAVQLGLYGARSRSASRLGKPYDDYLRECVHRGADPDEETSVSISFRYVADGAEHRYEVWRGWSLKDKTVRERVNVTKDDSVDQLLSEHWADLVEDLIPLGISQLFFFDAEKIRFLADEETDTASLGVAIKSLLGLDLAERLIADAAIVEKRLSEKVLDRAADERSTALQADLEAKSTELTDVLTEKASLENQRMRAKGKLDKAQAEFAAAGGDHWTRRNEVQARLKEAEVSIREAEEEIRSLCIGDLPLLLVTPLLIATFEQDAKEQDAATAAALNDALSKRDREVLKQLREEKLPKAAIDSVRSILDHDRKSRRMTSAADRLLDLSTQSRQTLARLTGGGVDTLRAQTTKLLTRIERLQSDREHCLRLVNATPAETTIASLLHQLQDAAAAFGQLDGEAKRLEERIAVLRRERDAIDRSLAELRRSLVDRQIAQEESLRMTRLAQRTQTTMREFLTRATTHKIDRLSEMVTDSFRFLLTKQTLVNSVQIHPDSFRIDLLDDKGTLIPKGRLSEGEKQIFAIALLWGLARAAPRQLPAIIDTPMARLDSEHRKHLIERYFPNASHQVIILSTDTEIEGADFEFLHPRVARSFHLRYDEQERRTIPEPGYFSSGAVGQTAEATR